MMTRPAVAVTYWTSMPTDDALDLTPEGRQRAQEVIDHFASEPRLVCENDADAAKLVELCAIATAALGALGRQREDFIAHQREAMRTLDQQLLVAIEQGHAPLNEDEWKRLAALIRKLTYTQRAGNDVPASPERRDPQDAAVIVDKLEALAGALRTKPRLGPEHWTIVEEAAAFCKMLWLRHGCDFSALYGDDGEMQCSRCVVDFRRDDVDAIRARFTQLGQEQIARALPPLSGPREGP